MSLSRAVSLAALIAVLLGGAIGLSHVGHADVTGACNNRTWNVVIGHTSDAPSIATINSRADKLVPEDCYASQPDPAGGYNAVAQFGSQADAQAFIGQLTAKGWARTYHVQPVLESSR